MKHVHGLRYAGLLFLTTLCVSGASGQRTATFYREPGTEPPEREVDMRHMRVEVSFVPQKGLVRGTVTHVFVPLRERVDSLPLDAPGIRILRTALNGKQTRFSTNADGVVVYFSPPLAWDETDSLQIVYEANPRRGIYFVGWNDSTGRSRKQIWTQGQGIDNRHWIPCYDRQNDKLTTETIVTFEGDYRVLSNGEKIEERQNPDGTKTWHYRMDRPHTTYLVMLGIGKYAVEHRTTRRGIPVDLWYYPESPERLEPTYRYSTEVIDFMEEHTGVPYPWGSYAQIPVQDFLYGAMENTTATVFGDFFLVDRRAFLDQNYVYVNAHELAHQWFGDFVTGRNGVSSWLQESFATFYPKLFMRRIYGEDMEQWRRRTEQNAALAASEKDRFPILHPKAGSDRVYSKGSAVLDMMMYVWGEEGYRRVIKHYLKEHAYANVETNDLIQAFQDVLGVTPSWFFEQWITRGGEPHYQVTYQDVLPIGRPGRETQITVRQVHDMDELVGPFTMPLVFQVAYADGSSDTTRVLVEERVRTITLPNPKGKTIAFVLFDPGSRILKKVTFERSFDELAAQARQAPLMIDRFDALVAMRALPSGTKTNFLAGMFGRERFFAPRAEIVTQLAGDSARSSREILNAAFHDPAQEVRLAAVNGVGRVTAEVKAPLERLLTDSSYAVVAAALRRLATEFPGELDRYLEITKNDRGIGNQIAVLRHELRAGRGDLDSLLDFTSNAFEFRTRVNAFEALKRLNYFDDRLTGNLFDAMTHWNPRLRGPATETAKYYGEQAAFKAALQTYYRAHTWQPWQKILLEGFVQGLIP